jgi:hypothetical protein
MSCSAQALMFRLRGRCTEELLQKVEGDSLFQYFKENV